MSTDLPPEAFTKETLQKAFNWLQDQPEPIRNSVHTPERLVSLFRKAQRIQNQDAPVSSKKFIHDLKDLAGSLDQFDAPSGKKEIPSPELPNPPQAELPPQFDFSEKSEESSTPVGLALDPLSQDRVDQVKKRLNLSSDQEALRALISLGFEKFSHLD